MRRHSHPDPLDGSPPPERGSVLLPTLFVVVLIGGLSFTLLQDGLTRRSEVNLEESRWRALQIAEKGLLHAEMEIRGNVDTGGDGLGTVAGTYAGGSYTATATEVSGSSGLYRVEVRGTHGHTTRRFEAGIRRKAPGWFQHAMFAKTSVVMSGGSWTDAYDSTKGTYASQITGSDTVSFYASGGGHVGSNGTLKIGGGAIRGDAIPGPLNVVERSGGAIIWGSTTPRSKELDVPNPTYASFAAAWAKNDNLSIDTSNPKVSYDAAKGELLSGGGAPITLTGGTYIFNTLKMTGGGTLRITGPSKIYITNYFEISGGGIANFTNKPENCLIISHPYDFPPGSKHDKLYVKTSGGSTTFFAVYAPANHYETSGGGDLFGSVVANSIVFSGGSGFHYDKALGNVGEGSGTAATERTYWIELDALP